MADLSDVEVALVTAVSSALGANGARVYRGWPMTAALDADLARGLVNVSVAAVPGAARNTTRWGVTTSVAGVAPGVTVTVAENTATFAGVANAGDMAGVLVGGKTYVYQAQAGDSAGLVAAALAELVRQTQICWLRNAAITVPGAASVIARTLALQPSTAEWSRQEQGFRVAVWSPTAMLRDTSCSAIGAAFAEIAFLTLADGTGGRLRYRSTLSIDDGQDAGVYRRDLIYDVEYATTVTTMLPAMLFADLDYNGATYFD